MRKALYLRLAIRNVWRTRQSWGPFLLASSLLTFALYSLAMLALSPQFSKNMGATGNAMTQILLMLGLVVVGCFTVLFMLYADGFLIRRRKRELGLYAVLGMERRHILRVQLWEIAQAYGVTLLFGLGLGMLLARLMFLLLRWLTKLEITVTGAPNPQALGLVAGMMGVMFLLLLLRHAVAVMRVNPIALLRADEQGEREPRARWLLALVGAAMLAAGYWIALTVGDPATALILFFVAVLLVIFGTYLLFLTTSIAVLKAMKMRKSFYYRSKHFVTVSGMLYRMKANAAGLASIAILTTMAMVTIGTTSALYLGTERTLDRMYPQDNYFSFRVPSEQAAAKEALLKWSEESGVPLTNVRTYRLRDASALLTRDGHLEPYGETASTMSVDHLHRSGWSLLGLTAVALEDYNAIEGTTLTLAPRELGWVGTAAPDTLVIRGETWTLRPLDPPEVQLSNGNIDYLNGEALLVFPTWADVEAFADYTRNIYEQPPAEPRLHYLLRWDWAGGTEAEQLRWEDEARGAILNVPTEHGYSYGQKVSTRAEYYGMYGALVFIGIFLGLVFLMGTLLIIYFKQLSEGYQDHDRYIILQKVGMSRQEVRRTVRRQILMVFLAPLLVALCHVGGSLHMIVLMLRMFGLVDASFISVCALGAAGLVAAAYLVFYWCTARTYYRLVQFTTASEPA